ncbi:hypothetical protein HQ708_07015 [Enterococcus faecium]|nr:hypothetical protein [Enterococcus faecium]
MNSRGKKGKYKLIGAIFLFIGCLSFLICQNLNEQRMENNKKLFNALLISFQKEIIRKQ